MKRTSVLGAVIAMAVAGLAPAAGHAAASSGWAGYLDVGVGGFWGSDGGNYYDGSSWDGAIARGTGKVAFDLSPAFTLQADGWLNHGWEHVSTGDNYTWFMGGLAAHASWRPAAATRVGAFASYGPNGGNGNTGTFGLEAQHWFGDTRVYGQLGRVAQIDQGDAGTSDTYAEAVVTHYINANLSLAGFLGLDHSRGGGADGWATDGWNWGARLEWKPDRLPISLYASFQGYAQNGQWNGTSNRYSSNYDEVMVGLRIPLGGSGGTLKSLDQAVGLTDMNPWYGDVPR